MTSHIGHLSRAFATLSSLRSLAFEQMHPLESSQASLQETLVEKALAQKAPALALSRALFLSSRFALSYLSHSCVQCFCCESTLLSLCEARFSSFFRALVDSEATLWTKTTLRRRTLLFWNPSCLTGTQSTNLFGFPPFSIKHPPRQISASKM